MSGPELGNDMTFQQPAGDELAFPDLKPGDAWGESITKRRAAELEAILQAWDAEDDHGEKTGPFDGEYFDFIGVSLSGADVFWLAARTSADTSEVQAVARAAETVCRMEVAIADGDKLHLEGACLDGARLDSANLCGVHLEGASLELTQLTGAYLIEAHLEGAVLHNAHLDGAALTGAHLESASLDGARLEGAFLIGADLAGASLVTAHLEGASLLVAQLEGASLNAAHLEGTHLFRARLGGADLQSCFFNSGTDLHDVDLGDAKTGYVSVADIRWGGVNLAVMDWTRSTPGFLRLHKRIEAIELGDEREAHMATDSVGYSKGKADRLYEYKTAVRANRQLATVLRSQGLNEDADRFAYKAQQLQREVLRWQGRYATAFGSWLLDIVAGYGYKPMRTLTVYLLAIINFAVAYFALGQIVGPHLSPLGAVVFSMTSFHGRGFFPGGIVLDDPITVLAAFEAFIGLVIEVSFIATFTQRFFAR